MSSINENLRHSLAPLIASLETAISKIDRDPLLSKRMLLEIKSEFKKALDFTDSQINLDQSKMIILVDDSYSVRELWKQRLKNSVKVYKDSIDLFIDIKENAVNIHECIYFIDVHLSDETGLDVVSSLNNLGVKNLYLLSGAKGEELDFEIPQFVSGFISNKNVPEFIRRTQ